MPSRQYTDPSGTLWDVFEVHRLGSPGSVRASLEGGWLAFVSAGEKRRLAQYPAAWLELTDDELHELLAAAFVAAEALYPFDPATGEPIGVPGRPSLSIDRRRFARSEPGEAEAAPVVVSQKSPVSTTANALSSTQPGSAEELVRIHARQARKSGQHAVHALVAVKRALTDAGEDTSPEMIKKVRRWFVEEFYFPG